MEKQFYSHLVEAHVIEQELENLNLSQKEKDELSHHVHSSIHYTVLDVVLTELPEEHKKTFIEHLNKNDHEKIWLHLKEHAMDVEEKIKDSANKLVKDFLEDIRKVKFNA